MGIIEGSWGVLVEFGVSGLRSRVEGFVLGVWSSGFCLELGVQGLGLEFGV